MRVLLFGASGMVGQGVLQQCLCAPGVTEVVCVSRRAGSLGLGAVSELVREVVTDDMFRLEGMAAELAGFDACFFCLGVSSFGMKEAAYRRVTHDLTLAVAHALLCANPERPPVFVYVSGEGTDPQSKTMWARVKGETEEALLALPFRSAWIFRPGLIVPARGIRSKTALYRLLYAVLRPVLPLLLRLLPRHANTTEQVGRAMLHVASYGYPRAILSPADISLCGQMRG